MVSFAAVRAWERGQARVWRAFGHLIVPGPGRLLAVPLAVVEGDMTQALDGCPVPWLEVWTVVDTPLQAAVGLPAERLAGLAPGLAQVFDVQGWVRDVVPARASVPTLVRLTGPGQVRLAWLGSGND